MKTSGAIGLGDMLAMLAALCLQTPACLAGDNTAQLWEKLRDAAAHPEKKVFGRWAVVERVPIVKQTEGVPTEYAAAASILDYYNHGVGNLGPLFSGNEQVLDSMKRHILQDLRKGNASGEKCAMPYFQRMEDLKKDMASGIPKKGAPPSGAQMSALLLRLAEKESGPHLPGKTPGVEPLERALAKSYAERLFVPAIRREKATYETCRILLDNGIPLVLIGGKDRDAALVCVGYIETGEGRWLITGDPKKVECMLVSRVDVTLYGGDENTPENVKKHLEASRQRDRNLDAQFGKLVRDYSFTVNTAEKAAGLALTSWQDGWDMLMIPQPRPSDRLVASFCDGVLKGELTEE